MCLPILAPIGLALGASATSAAAVGTVATATVVAGGVAAYGAYQQGQAQKNLMNYQAQAAETQQNIVQSTARANITGVQDQAAREATMLARNQATVRGAQKAAFGAQGMGDSVTAADVAKDTYNKQELDKMTLQYNANVKTWSITNNMNAQLWGLGSQKTQYEMGARNSEIAGNINAGSSLLNTASQVGTQSLMFGKSFVPSTGTI